MICSLFKYAVEEFIVYNYFFRAVKFRCLKKHYPHQKPPSSHEAIKRDLIREGFRISICSRTIKEFPVRIQESRLPWYYRLNMILNSFEQHDFTEQKLFQIFTAAEQIMSLWHPVVVDAGSSFFQMRNFIQGIEGKLYRLDRKFKPGIHNCDIGASAQQIPLGENSLDLIYLLSAFEHFEKETAERSLKEFFRILKPKGILLIIPLYLANEDFVIIEPLMKGGRNLLDREQGKLIVNNSIFGHETSYTRYYSPTSFSKSFAFIKDMDYTLNWNQVYGFFYLRVVKN